MTAQSFADSGSRRGNKRRQGNFHFRHVYGARVRMQAGNLAGVTEITHVDTQRPRCIIGIRLYLLSAPSWIAASTSYGSLVNRDDPREGTNNRRTALAVEIIVFPSLSHGQVPPLIRILQVGIIAGAGICGFRVGAACHTDGATIAHFPPVRKAFV